jgi:hypothetical protein
MSEPDNAALPRSAAMPPDDLKRRLTVTEAEARRVSVGGAT